MSVASSPSTSYHVESSKPVAILVRPGKTPSGHKVRSLLKHLVRRIRRHWSHTHIVFRGDSHCGRAEVMAHSHKPGTVRCAEPTAESSLGLGNYVTDRNSLTPPRRRHAHPATAEPAR